MGKITVETCGIEGLKMITPAVFGDERGYFMETYNYLNNLASWGDSAKKKLLDSWYSDNRDSVFIKPKMNYDLLINTKDFSIPEIFEIIRSMIRHDDI